MRKVSCNNCTATLALICCVLYTTNKPLGRKIGGISTCNVHFVKCCICYLLESFMHTTKRDFRIEMLAISSAQFNYIPRTFILTLFYLDFRLIKFASLMN